MTQIQREFCAEMRRQMAGEQVRRYVRTLPAFEVERELPDSMARLLKELDRQVAPRAGGGAR